MGLLSSGLSTTVPGRRRRQKGETDAQESMIKSVTAAKGRIVINHCDHTGQLCPARMLSAHTHLDTVVFPCPERPQIWGGGLLPRSYITPFSLEQQSDR